MIRKYIRISKVSLGSHRPLCIPDGKGGSILRCKSGVRLKEKDIPEISSDHQTFLSDRCIIDALYINASVIWCQMDSRHSTWKTSKNGTSTSGSKPSFMRLVHGPGNKPNVSILHGSETSKRHNNDENYSWEDIPQNAVWIEYSTYQKWFLRLSGAILHSSGGTVTHNCLLTVQINEWVKCHSKTERIYSKPEKTLMTRQIHLPWSWNGMSVWKYTTCKAT